MSKLKLKMNSEAIFAPFFALNFLEAKVKPCNIRYLSCGYSFWVDIFEAPSTFYSFIIFENIIGKKQWLWMILCRIQTLK